MIEGVAVFGIWENGFVFWDFYWDSIWHCIDGWVGENDGLPKRQTNCKGMMIHCPEYWVLLINVIDFLGIDNVEIKLMD